MLKKQNKKGMLGLDTVGATIKWFLIIAVLGIAVFLALSSLQNASLFTAGSQADNQTTNVINNVTTGTADFFANAPTIFAVLGAVVIILAIMIIVQVVSRMSGKGGGGL